MRVRSMQARRGPDPACGVDRHDACVHFRLPDERDKVAAWSGEQVNHLARPEDRLQERAACRINLGKECGAVVAEPRSM